MNNEITVYSVKMENGTEQYFKTLKDAKYWKSQDERRVYMGKRIRTKTEAWYVL
jgi:hypothetical protein